MTDKKISELTNILGSQVDDANDELAIVDSSAGTTNSITRAELFKDIDGDITLSGTVDGRDVAADGSKLDGIETNADVTDTANVTAAGALMDSELTSEASVKALDQGVATTDSPDFAGLSVDTDTLYVDSTNNRVGIGTSSPSYALDVNAFRARIGSTNAQLRLESSSSAYTGAIEFVNGSVGTIAGQIRYRHDDDSMRFSANNSEAMRIDSSGNLLVGTTEAPGTVVTSSTQEGLAYQSGDYLTVSRSGGAAIQPNRLTSDGDIIAFRRAGSTVGSISVTSSTTSYNTSSDERLKENIADAQPASDLIDGIQVRQFDWKADGEHQRYGMIAQELETVAPEAVTKGDTEDDMWAVDYSKLVPMLVKEIQDLRKRVEELENTQ